MKHAFLTAGSIGEVAALNPDFSALEHAAGDTGVNAAAGAGDQWTTRMFVPGSGINEDAATGSAAGPLACHLARHGLIDFGQQITISQGAQIGRPSTLLATVHGTRDAISRVEVAGSAVIVASGTFDL